MSPPSDPARSSVPTRRVANRRRVPPKRAKLQGAEFAAMRGLLFGLRAMPLGLAYRFVELLVRLTYYIGRYRRRALDNIATAFGDTLDAKQRGVLFRRSLGYHAWFWVDALLAPWLLRDPRYKDRVDVREVDAALRRGDALGGEGALLVSSHQGTAEIGSLAIAAAGWPHAAVARPLDNRRIWEWLIAQRHGFPRTQIDKTGALRACYKLLKTGGLVAIQIDQDAGRGGVFVPYFDKLASTHSGAGLLAAMSGAPVYMFFCLRTAPREFAHRLLFSGPFRARRSGNQDDDVRELTARMTAEIEQVARAYPEQVMWVHRRWKTRPPGETAA